MGKKLIDAEKILNQLRSRKAIAVKMAVETTDPISYERWVAKGYEIQALINMIESMTEGV